MFPAEGESACGPPGPWQRSHGMPGLSAGGLEKRFKEPRTKLAEPAWQKTQSSETGREKVSLASVS